ncbi:MAG: TonB-dependent receptor [Pseudomonadota bacterium]
MSKSVRPLTFILVTSTLSPIATASDNLRVEDLLSMPLEELLAIKVNSASKRDESIALAPGSITSWSHNDMRQIGAVTLSDLANVTPGFSTRSALANDQFETRGITDPLNARHLLIVDGIPLNHARDFMVLSQTPFPSQTLRQVEFLRGPASALYGTSAFLGVIEVHPLELDTNGSFNEFLVARGNADDDQLVMAYSLNKNDSGRLRLAVGHQQKAASLFEIPQQDPQRNLLQDQFDNLYGDFSYRVDSGPASGVSFGFFHIKKTSGFGESWTGGQDTSAANKEVREVSIPYLKYQTAVAEKWSMNGYFKYNRSTESGTQTNQIWGNPFFFDYLIVTENSELQLETKYRQDGGDDLIAGLNYDVRHQVDGDSYIFNPAVQSSANTDVFSEQAESRAVYLQQSLAFDGIGHGSQLTLGARQDEGRLSGNTYTQLSPRVAFTQRITPELNVKALIGKALKVPGIKEIGHNREKAPALVSDALIPNLEPESIYTRELVLTYATARVLANLTYFNMVIADQIRELSLAPDAYIDPDSDAPGIFQNSRGETRSEGWEAAIRSHLSDNSWLFANISLADTKDPNNEPVANAPHLKTNVGFSYSANRLTATAVAKHVDEYAGTNGAKPYQGQLVVDVNLSWSLSEAMAVDMSFFNLFDETYFQANNGADGIPKYGRTARLTLRGQL